MGETKVVSYRLTKEIDDLLNDVSANLGITKTEVVKTILLQSLPTMLELAKKTKDLRNMIFEEQQERLTKVIGDAKKAEEQILMQFDEAIRGNFGL